MAKKKPSNAQKAPARRKVPISTVADLLDVLYELCKEPGFEPHTASVFGPNAILFTGILIDYEPSLPNVELFTTESEPG